jgi:hypothetical protein
MGVAGLIGLILGSGYLIWYFAKKANTLYMISQEANITKRMDIRDGHLSMLYKLNWYYFGNRGLEEYGPIAMLQPIYYRLLGLGLDLALFMLVAGLAEWWPAQLAVLALFTLGQLARLAWSRPHALAQLDYLLIARELTMLLLLTLTLVSTLFYNINIHAQTQTRLLIFQDHFEKWFWMGWGILALYVASVGMAVGY